MVTITNYYEREFFQEMLALNILPPTVVSRVTDNIQEIIAFIQGIVDKGHAYTASDGGSYLSLMMKFHSTVFQLQKNKILA